MSEDTNIKKSVLQIAQVQALSWHTDGFETMEQAASYYLDLSKEPETTDIHRQIAKETYKQLSILIMDDKADAYVLQFGSAEAALNYLNQNIENYELAKKIIQRKYIDGISD